MVIPPERLGAALILFHLSVASLLVVMMQIPYSSAVMSFERMNYYAVVGIVDVLLKLAIVLVLPYISYDKLAVYALLVFLISVVDFFSILRICEKELQFVEAEAKLRQTSF